MTVKKILLTADGLKSVREELKAQEAKREQLVEKIEDVSQPGEFGEDILVSQLKQELELVEERISSLEETLGCAQVISGAQSNGCVALGNKVKISSPASTHQFCIVSHLEADPTKNKISNESPLGQSLLGKKVGEKVEINAPVGKIVYKIISID